MSHLLSVSGTLPEHRYTQSDVTEVFSEVLAPHKPNLPLLQRVHSNAGVDFRHLALPLERYPELKDFGASNDEFIRVAVDLGAQAVEEALAAAGLTVREVDLVVSATITGLAVPSVEARIAARIGLREDVKRVPLVGLGCVAGAAGVARVHDYLLGHPGDVAVLVSTELCSLTVQRDDTSMANLVASGLFGDGAAAVVMVGADHPAAKARPAAGDAAPTAVGGDAAPTAVGGETPPAALRVLATRSRMYADTERAMGWDVGASGLRIVLGVEVPGLVRDNLREDVDGFLADHGLTRDDIAWWVAHPGGPKVLEAMQDALEVDRHALAMTWDSLARIGNLSSASVLHVLADTLRDRPPPSGTHGMLLAMGPGFCLEMVLLHAPGA